ncbi:hypothetical protein SUNI508_13596 [Seiridium unicorne]|uniref:Uncharacterized protein n=1 Tax=Seiridium unicorne TaxID=138068 RepID=A0ABR2VC78_9PEZI
MCNQFRPTTLQNQSRAPGDLDPFRTRRELLVRIFQPGGLSGFSLAGHSYLKPEDIRHINLQIDMIDHVLKVIGDTQLLNGISLLIGAFAQHETLEFYHFHMVVSVAIAMSIVFKEPRAVLHRGMLLFIFMALYIGFVVLFGLKLRSWDDNDPGRCYRSDRISGKDATHPYVDTVYLAITALWLFIRSDPISVYLIQVYHKTSNEAYLSGGSENEWGFGQVVALTLVASTFLECVRGTIRYNILKNERDDSKEGIFWKRFLRFLQIPEPDADEEAGRVADDGSSTVVSRRRSLPEGFKYT